MGSDHPCNAFLMPCFTAVKVYPQECRFLVPEFKKLETKVFAPSIRRFAPLSLTLVALGLSACGTTSSGPAQRIAVVEEDTQGTSSVNIASLSDVIQRNPNDPGAYNTRGAAYARLGRYSDAMTDFTKAVQIDPNHAPAYTNRALALRQTNRNDQALADFSRAIQADPNYGPAYIGRANLLRTQGNFQEAL